MKEFFVLLFKEFKSIKKEKTIMFAIFIQLFIASFSSIILIGIMSFYDPTSIGDNTQVTINVGITGNNTNTMAYYLKERNLNVEQFPDLYTAEQAFKAGEVNAVMLVPDEINGHIDMTLILPEIDSSKTLILMILNEPLREYENYLREMHGVNLNYSDLEGKAHTTREFLYSVIIPILMLFPAFIAGSIVIDTISEEIENKTLDTLWSAPLSLNHIFGSKITSAIVLAVVQCILWIILLRFNNFSVHNLGMVLSFSVIIAACITFTASLIALYYKDRERSQFVFSIALLVITGSTYLLDPSPLSLITRLAAGDNFIKSYNILLYTIPLVVLMATFFITNKKILSFKS